MHLTNWLLSVCTRFKHPPLPQIQNNIWKVAGIRFFEVNYFLQYIFDEVLINKRLLLFQTVQTWRGEGLFPIYRKNVTNFGT